MVLKQTKGRPEVHGHRGSRGTHPENTLPAFQEAATCGADFLELDLQMTADDVPMVFHDPQISPRLCTRRDGRPITSPIAVRSLNAAALREFECGEIAQSSFPQQRPIPGATIPRFSDVLSWAQSEGRIGLNVELKSEAVGDVAAPDPQSYAEIVLDLIRRERLLPRVRLQSFDFEPLRILRRLEPNATLACLFEDPKRDFIGETLAVGAQIVAPFYEWITPDFVAEVHRRGLRLIPWTVNDSSWWQNLTSWGIDGIITDYPRKLLEQLKGR